MVLPSATAAPAVPGFIVTPTMKSPDSSKLQFGEQAAPAPLKVSSSGLAAESPTSDVPV